jgi:hypothetical protein
VKPRNAVNNLTVSELGVPPVVSTEVLWCLSRVERVGRIAIQDECACGDEQNAQVLLERKEPGRRSRARWPDEAIAMEHIRQSIIHTAVSPPSPPQKAYRLNERCKGCAGTDQLVR